MSFQICNASSQEELDRIIDEDEERFTDRCGWARTDMITVQNKHLYRNC